ncbi:hypothetical protein WISP_112901 [Willisornis vidua]|uniref:Reverse transcriptase domain-containing protein n=1 Tax=Willisornis vidua TaxID=1566151 RepID=A0ABQ9CUY3_9PASS|nr:hypothetical protein WISP_112901 [Willisornis vidua]
MPENWKKTNLIPVFKKEKKKDPGNYQPINPTSTPEKVMECLILEAISIHMDNKKVIKKSQHGFTKGKSCLNNLIGFYNVTNTWIDEGRAVDIPDGHDQWHMVELKACH